MGPASRHPEREKAASAAGRASALKAGLWALSAGRKPLDIATKNRRLPPHERRALAEYMALGQMVGSGPPLFRSRQLLALAEAGLVTFLGPRAHRSRG